MLELVEKFVDELQGPLNLNDTRIVCHRKAGGLAGLDYKRSGAANKCSNKVLLNSVGEPVVTFRTQKA